MIPYKFIKPVYYILLLFLFISLIFLALQINVQEINNHKIIIYLLVFINLISFLIFYFKTLEGKIRNYKLLQFKKYSLGDFVVDLIYLGIAYTTFTPKPFINYLIYYLLLFIFLAFYFTLDKLQLKKIN
jgi:hypothetical protein